MFSCCSVAQSCPTLLRAQGLQPTRLLCPRNLPGKNNGVSCHFLLQEILPTQGSNLHLLHWQMNSLALSHLGNSQTCLHVCVCAKSLQSCLTLCDPVDCSLPGSSVQETLQARILEWVAMPSSRRCFQPRDQTRVSSISCLGR